MSEIVCITVNFLQLHIPFKYLKVADNSIKFAKIYEKVLRCLRLKVEHVFNDKSESSKIFILK